MNLTDIDLNKAQPIDFDDIREGDTILIAWDHSARVFEVSRKSANVLENASTQLQPRNEDGGSWFLLDRPVPPSPEPGTTGTATVAGRPNQWVARIRTSGGPLWTDIEGGLHGQVTDFVADPAPGIPQELDDAIDRLRDAWKNRGAKTLDDAADAVINARDLHREARDV